MSQHVIVIKSPERRAVRPGNIDNTRKMQDGIARRELQRWGNPDASTPAKESK